MDQNRLKEMAEALEEAFLVIEDKRYQHLYQTLKPILDDAKNKKITEPLEFLPGRYFFQEAYGRQCSENEEGLGPYSEISNRYADFSLRATSSDKSYQDTMDFLEKMRKEREENKSDPSGT